MARSQTYRACQITTSAIAVALLWCVVVSVFSACAGRSAATVHEVKSTLDDGSSDVMNSSCWRNPITVEAGGTLDTFDVGWNSLGNCAPGVESRAEGSRVAVVVTFSDDDGHRVSVEAAVAVED
jgi:hypothetical protein